MPDLVNVHTRLPLVLTLLLLLLSACESGPEAAPVEEPSPGRLVVIGGGLSSENEAVYRAVLEGRDGEGPVCVVPTAGASPERSMESAVESLEQWGGPGAARGIFISTENPESARDPEVARELRDCGGFYFTGGVQSRIVDVFRPDGQDTPAYNALMDRFADGAVVAGSSAGAAMMSHPMIAGGGSEEAFVEGLDGGVQLADGMDFLPDLLVDQHFLARGRIGRLMVAVLDGSGYARGAGVDENTALVVDGGQAWVVGASGVVMLEALREGGEERRALRVQLLGAGDTMELASGEVSAAADKLPVEELIAADADGDGFDAPESPADGLFERWVFLHLLHHLAGLEEGTVSMEAAEHRFTFRTDPDVRGVAYPEVGVRGTPLGLSVGPVEVEIQPVASDG